MFFLQIFHGVIELDVRIWIAILILPTVLLSFIRTLKVLAVISMVSNILYFVGVFCILLYASDHMKSPASLPKFTGLATVPLAYGAIVFSLEGIGVVSIDSPVISMSYVSTKNTVSWSV